MRFDLLEGEEVAVPSVADVLWLHDNGALIEGGMPGVLDEGALASALARPMHVAAYSDEDPDLVLLAAYLWHGVSEGHAFVDANKRTAVLTMIAFLASNGIAFDTEEREVGLFVDAAYKRDLFAVKWLEDYLRSRCHWIE